MPSHLVPLALGAWAKSLPNALVNGGPDDLAAHEMLDGPDAAMLVVGVEKSPAEGRRSVRARIVEGDVTS